MDHLRDTGFPQNRDKLGKILSTLNIIEMGRPLTKGSPVVVVWE